MEEKDPPKSLNFIVITIWVVAAVVILIAVLSRDPNRSKPIELIIQTTTALAGAVAAIAAFMTVKMAAENARQLQADRDRELFTRKPNLTFMNGDTSFSKDKKMYLSVEFKNAGVHPARDISAQLTFIEGSLENAPELSLLDSIANDIASGVSFNLTFSGFKLQHEATLYYMVFFMQCRDAVTDYLNFHEFYLECPKFGYMHEGGLYHVSRKERDMIKARLESSAENRKATPTQSVADPLT